MPMADPEQQQQQQREIEASNTVGHDVGTISVEQGLSAGDADDQETPDADVVMPLVSELAQRTGGVVETQNNSVNTKSNLYVGDNTRSEGLTQSRSNAHHVLPTGATPSTYLSHDQAVNGYLSSNLVRSQSSRKNLRNSNLPSGQSSSGSLHTLAEQEGSDTSLSVRRALSTRSAQGPQQGRRHSRSSSTSQSLNKRTMNNEHPVYPDQSFLALQSQVHVGRPYPILRSRSSHPPQNTIYPDMSSSTISAPNSRDKLVLPTTARTADNTPMTSPGLFSPQAIRANNPKDGPRSGSPQLHHLQAPKETHAAEIDHDLMTGNKIINTYEVIKELGRGEHGKVKLGRDMESDTYVAIKIVPRYSKHRRLGRLGEPQDQTKREVAILKKARHPNVVSLLEVIDDPNKNKVYLVLEYVDIGEIKWRRLGVSAITNINNKRFESERKGISLTLEPTDGDLYLVKLAAMRHEALERNRQHIQQPAGYAHYSFEHESEDGDILERSVSQQFNLSNAPSRTHSEDDYVGTGPASLAGSMYGAYDDRSHRAERKHSVATAFSAVSHMSSEHEYELEDDQFSYVPALTQDEARRAFRDTLLGLEFLHGIGIIHRDIKPSNLLVGSGDIVKISDFGVSYLGRPTTDEEAESKTFEAEGNPLDDEKELARSVGTPAFWAPELCYEDTSIFADNSTPRVTGALDLWALGITLYCMIYARLPFYANDNMGLHEAVCTSEVCCPKTRLVAADTTSQTFITEPKGQMNSNKRLDYELKFEVVPDNLRDLIKKLLIKDPAQRITIAGAKKHPWVLEGIPDYAKWMESQTDKGKKKILEVNEKEISHAVVKRSIIERTFNATVRLAGSLLGRKDNRKRASSTATSTSGSSESLNTPSGSSASTVGKIDRAKESNRSNHRGDEVLHALHKSREMPEHPLAQSQSASPDGAEHPEFFTEEMSRQMTHLTETGSGNDIEPRPSAPDRAISSISTAESNRTLKAAKDEIQSAVDRPREPDPSMLSEGYVRSRMEQLWEGTTRTLNRFSSVSRDRRSRGPSRSSSISRHSSESDFRALPSLALTTTHATGAIESPESLQSPERSSTTESTTVSVPMSPETSQHVYHQPEISSVAAFEEAQNVNQRRLILENQEKAANDAIAAHTEHEPSRDDCPPSPDDFTFQQRPPTSPRRRSADFHSGVKPSAPSASTIASSTDEYGNSSVFHSHSNPSFGATSGASSPLGDMFISAEYKSLQDTQQHNVHTAETEPEFMRTADTVIEHGRTKPAVATGKPLEDHDEIYDTGHEADDNYDDESEDEGIVMGGPKKTAI